MEIVLNKRVPVAGEYDVVVCGGGPSGFIAAIAAAGAGARTALIERYGFLGGMATAGLVMPISVFSYNDERVIGGIPWNFVERLRDMGGAIVEQPLNNISFDPELYKLCAQRMVNEAGVDCYMNSWISDCDVSDGTIRHVIFENKNGTEALSGKVFIDATGDADIAHMAGVPMQPVEGWPLQPASMIFCLDGVDTESELVKSVMHHNKQGVNFHCEPIRAKLAEISEKKDIPSFGGPWFCTLIRKGAIAVNMSRRAADACDNRDFSRAEQALREDAFALTQLLRENFPEFKDCRLSATAAQAGPRETRRILGAHTITAGEYLNAFNYPDSVSRGCHPIDIHIAGENYQNLRFLEKAAYVPYRALYAGDFPNLLASGRCLSADREAFASLRVQASAMGAGQASGVAAAMCAKSGLSVADADVAKLQAELRKLGAVI
ncbi:MAG: FAD-dependent oxidoreductase [Clostridia bacterium]|nr:FAD-dependent oxidoreductase [Clostridia bacterium]